jgi:hypothetical protein
VVAGAEARSGDELDDSRAATLALAQRLEDDLGAAQLCRLALARSEKRVFDRHGTLLRVAALTVIPPRPVVYKAFGGSL